MDIADVTTPTLSQVVAARDAVERARFDLERANRACYYASNYAREHRGQPEARQALEAADARRERAEKALREAEAALEDPTLRPHGPRP